MLFFLNQFECPALRTTDGRLFFILKGGKGSGFFGHKGRIGNVGGSLKNAESVDAGYAPDNIENTLDDKDFSLANPIEFIENHSEPFRDVNFSEDAYRKDFPDDRVKTPIGTVKLGDNQIKKLFSKERDTLFGLIKPIFNDPTFIVTDKDSKEHIEKKIAEGKTIFREFKLLFIKAFTKKDKQGNEKIRYYCSVTISNGGGLEVSISTRNIRERQILNAIRDGEVIWKKGDKVEQHPYFGSTLTDVVAPSGRGAVLAKATSWMNYNPIFIL